MKKDALGVIFRVEKRLGRGDLFEIISHFSSGKSETTVFQHEYTDGFGALLKESEKWSGAQITLPPFKLATRFSPSSIASALKGLKEDFSAAQTRWKSLDVNAPYTPDHLAWRVFSRSATEQLLTTSRRLGISVNTLILTAVNQAVAEHLLHESQRECRWLLPVNMRRKPNELRSMANHTSSVGVTLHRDDSAEQIEANYRRSINKWHALSAETLAQSITKLGEERLYHLAQKRGSTNFRIGSFSNLGIWNFPTAGVDDRWPMAITITPPAGTPCFPVGVGIITWQGHLSLSLRLHAGLINQDPHLSEFLLGEFTRRLTRMVDCPLETLRSSAAPESAPN
ncbi:MAG: hypothetical protein RLZZ488_2100 [Pseudomonadota bacterium]|jgi:hypothetical protein